MPAKRKTARRAVKKAASRKAAAKPKRASAPKRAPAPKRAAKPKRAAPKRSAAPKRRTTKQPSPKRSTTRRPSRGARSSASTRTRIRGTSPRRPPQPRADFTPPPSPEPAEPERPATEAWPDEEYRPAVRGDTITFEETGVQTEPVPAWGQSQQAIRERVTETYTEDIPVAVAALALAASVFLPWYAGQSGFDVTVSAWESGTWGPIVFFLGLGSFVLVLLRRLGVRLSLPFEEALLHEVAGWVALAGGVIKSRYRPGAEGLLGISWGLWVGLLSAFVLAFLAGRMAPQAPLVRRPRWYRERGGAPAAALIILVIAGSAVFGAINKTPPLFTTGIPTGDIPGVITGRLPDCAEGFPVPSILRPFQGHEQPCRADLQSDRPVSEVVAALRQTLQGAGWTATVGAAGGTTTLNITAPKCATAAILGSQQGSLTVVVFGICATPTPSPT